MQSRGFIEGLDIKNVFENSARLFSLYNEISQKSLGEQDSTLLIHAEHLFVEFLNHLQLLAEGRLPLRTDDYFRRITEEMLRCGPGQQVVAVHSFDERRLSQDVLQANYVAKNLLAADRGVLIQRVFIIDEAKVGDPAYRDAFSAIKSQNEHENISVILVSSSAVYPKPQDWVMFPSSPARIYVASPGPGALKLHVDCAHVIEDFEGSYSTAYLRMFQSLADRVDETIYERVFADLEVGA